MVEYNYKLISTEMRNWLRRPVPELASEAAKRMMCWHTLTEESLDLAR